MFISLLLAFLALCIDNTGASSFHVRQAHRVRQTFGSAHDSLCNKAMCIEATVQGDTAQYVLRSTGAQKLGWMALGFGHLMSDSAMVIMWPSSDADGSYASVTLSQRKAPYETMPTPDPHPPFVATLELSETSVTGDHPQMGFIRPAPPDGMQDIIWAFSRTPPESADEDAHISVHHLYGIGDEPLPTSSSVPSPEAGDIADGGNTTRPTDGASAVGGGFASFVHAGLCILAFLLVIPSGALVVRYAKATGSSAAFACIGICNLVSWWGTALVLLYCVQCAVGFWVQRIPESNRTSLHRVLLAGLGVCIVLLAFYDAWLGFVAAGDSPLLWCILFVVIPSLYLVGVVMIQRRFGSVLEDAKGDYVVLDTRGPTDEVEDEARS
ncbi:hypothetical protein BJV77DRAFT_1006009 [Russula vinacea]|nr:hypothetical protein BJV77DRAFT_1006009 [Russula vinacea]